MAEPALYNPDDLKFVQARAELNLAQVKEYENMMKAGVEFDPCLGLLDDIDGRIYIYDGCHRGAAAKNCGHALLCIVEDGTQEEAEWRSLSMNIKHGLRRNYSDIKRIVKAALCHPNGRNLSSREIARHCGVSDKTVEKYRTELTLSAEIPQIERRVVTRDGSTYEMKPQRMKRTPPEIDPDTLPNYHLACIFCGKMDQPLFKSGATSAGICQDCAAKALRQLDDQLEFEFYGNDRMKMVQAGLRVFRVSWEDCQLKEYKPAINGASYSWQIYAKYDTKAACKKEMKSLMKDNMVVFENH